MFCAIRRNVSDESPTGCGIGMGQIAEV